MQLLARIRILPCLMLIWAILAERAVARTETFRRGDANRDQKHDLSDAVTILSHLFLGTGALDCEMAGDVNDDNKIDISDPVSLLNHLFLGGPPPPSPYPEPGEDPTPGGSLGCSQCGSALTRPGAIACGRSGVDCAVLEDVVIQREAHFRNDAPAISLGSQGSPHVIFSVAEGGYFGFQADRQLDGTWVAAEMTDDAGTPVHLATADLVTDVDGSLLALVNSGDLHTALWKRDGARWTDLGDVPKLDGGRNHGLVSTTTGCLYAALETINEGPTQPRIGQRHGDWTFDPIAGEESSFGSVIALTPQGLPKVAYWATIGASWTLRIGGGASDGVDGLAETVADLGSNSLDRNGIALELTAPSEPHILFSRPINGGGYSIEYRSKTPAGEWQSVEVALEEPVPDCGQPAVEGQTCEYEHTSFKPHRALADAEGRVLLIYSRVSSKVTLTARCGGGFPGGEGPPGPPPPLCQWEGTQEITGDILGGWIGNGALKSAVLASGVSVASLDVAVDGQGQLHFAVYELDNASGNTTVRYLRVGAR